MIDAAEQQPRTPPGSPPASRNVAAGQPAMVTASQPRDPDDDSDTDSDSPRIEVQRFLDPLRYVPQPMKKFPLLWLSVLCLAAVTTNQFLRTFSSPDPTKTTTTLSPVMRAQFATGTPKVFDYRHEDTCPLSEPTETTASPLVPDELKSNDVLVIEPVKPKPEHGDLSSSLSNADPIVRFQGSQKSETLLDDLSTGSSSEAEAEEASLPHTSGATKSDTKLHTQTDLANSIREITRKGGETEKGSGKCSVAKHKNLHTSGSHLR